MRGVAPKDGALGYGWTYTEEVREEARLRMGHFIDRACVDRREGGHTELYLRRVCGAGGFEAYKEARYGALLAAKLVARSASCPSSPSSWRASSCRARASASPCPAPRAAAASPWTRPTRRRATREPPRATSELRAKSAAAPGGQSRSIKKHNRRENLTRRRFCDPSP